MNVCMYMCVLGESERGKKDKDNDFVCREELDTKREIMIECIFLHAFFCLHA